MRLPWRTHTLIKQTVNLPLTPANCQVLSSDVGKPFFLSSLFLAEFSSFANIPTTDNEGSPTELNATRARRDTHFAIRGNFIFSDFDLETQTESEPISKGKPVVEKKKRFITKAVQQPESVFVAASKKIKINQQSNFYSICKARCNFVRKNCIVTRLRKIVLLSGGMRRSKYQGITEDRCWSGHARVLPGYVPYPVARICAIPCSQDMCHTL